MEKWPHLQRLTGYNLLSILVGLLFLTTVIVGAVNPFSEGTRAGPTVEKPATEYLAVGQAALQNGDLEGALIAFSQAIKRNPTLASAYVGRGVVYLETGQFGSALINLDRAVDLSPQDC